jgi:hypothetical protein
MTDHPVSRFLPEDEEEPFRPADEAAAAPSAEQSYPWDEPAPDDPDALSPEVSAEEGPRQRHDAFTEVRKCAFLKALVKVGCILDACRLVGPSPRTVYRHQESDPRFLRHCQIALKMSGAPVELTAWERAVEGVEEEIAVGGKMVKRRRYSENLLRLLLQGSNPKKYGPRPGFKRKRLLRHERKQMEREIRAELEAHRKLSERPVGEAIKSILTKIEAIERHEEPGKLAAGWTKSPDGHWVPPGYGPIEGWVAPPAAVEGEEPPHDSL